MAHITASGACLGSVDTANQALMTAPGNWGEYGVGDLNRDGVVNSADLAMLNDDWGRGLGAGRLSMTDNIIGYAGYVFNAEIGGSGLYTVRKNSQSNRSERGAATQAMLMSICRTLELRGHDASTVIADALRQRHRRPAPAPARHRRRRWVKCYTGGSGGYGLSSRATDVRLMDPVTTGKYQYPTGYGSYGNATGQTINPYTGQTLFKADPWWHNPAKWRQTHECLL